MDGTADCGTSRWAFSLYHSAAEVGEKTSLEKRRRFNRAGDDFESRINVAVTPCNMTKLSEKYES